MQFLKQSTASQSVVIGPFVDSTDGVTAETALTISAADIRLSKNGGNIVAKNSGGGTHDEIGYYTVTLDATDTNTVGRLQLMVNESGALPVYHEFTVLEEAIYDALFGASADAFDANARVKGIAGTTTTLDALNDVSAADVNAQCDAALADYDAPTKAELDSGFAGLNDPTAAAIADAVWDEATTGHTTAGTFGEQVKTDIDAILTDTGTTVPNQISGLNDPTAAAVADAVWDEAQSGHVAAGSFGEMATEIASILADTNELQTDNVPGLIAALNDPAASAIADAVLDEVVEGSYTLRQLTRLFASALLGQLSGAATATNTFRDLANSKNRITATVDSNGNRTAVTLDGT